MAATTEARAPAKVNLCLHVTGQRDDGYHLLDSLVVFADVGDRLRVSPSGDLTLTVDGPFAEGVPGDERNLVLGAAKRLRDLRGVSAGAHLHLSKHLPHGGGIGGGSSDAASALRLLADLWNVPPLTPGEALPLGADVPVCLSPRPQRMRGIGEILTAVPAMPSFAMVLINPAVHVATPAVFRALSRKDNPPVADIPQEEGADWVDWLRRQRNDMEPAALALAPVIGDALGALQDAQLARMSGSGATCFGIYRDARSAQAAADRISRHYADWWVVPCRTLSGAGDGLS